MSKNCKEGNETGMKIIRISTDNEVTVQEYPDGNTREQLEELHKLLGSECNHIEHVMPERLYTVLGASNRATKAKGSCVNMLVDEEGYYHQLPVNILGSYLYKTDVHGYPILGNILITGEVWTNNGIDFCGLSGEQFNLVYPQILKIAEKIKAGGEK